jgi:hypothetical protein
MWVVYFRGKGIGTEVWKARERFENSIEGDSLVWLRLVSKDNQSQAA